MSVAIGRALPLLGFCAVLAAQSGAGAVEGDVTDCVSHRPIAGARVKLRAGERMLFTRSDSSGRFQFQEAPAGNLEVTADQPGYMNASHYVRAAGPVHLSLIRYAVVAGSVKDWAGVPVEGVRVELLTLRPGEANMVAAAGTTTNDLGEYRFARLSAGSYYVRAHPRLHYDDSDESERATWFPRALQSSTARAVAVAAGQEVSKIDIPLVRQAGVRIAGYASAPAGNPSGRAVMLHTNVAVWRLDAPREARAQPRLHHATGGTSRTGRKPGDRLRPRGDWRRRVLARVGSVLGRRRQSPGFRGVAQRPEGTAAKFRR